VWAEAGAVHWLLGPSPEEILDDVDRVGAAPVTLDFVGPGGPWTVDASALVAKRRGALFRDLFVSEDGLFIRLQGHPILQLGRAESLTDGQTILFAVEGD
jgi:hypothetical protein